MKHDYPEDRHLSAPLNTLHHRGRFPCPSCSNPTGTDRFYTRHRWLTFQCLTCEHIFKKSAQEIGAKVNNLTPDSTISLQITVAEGFQLLLGIVGPEEAMRQADLMMKRQETNQTDKNPTNPLHIQDPIPPPPKHKLPFFPWFKSE